MKLKSKSIYLFINNLPSKFIKSTTIPENITISDQMKFISYGYNRTKTTYQLTNKIESMLATNNLYDLRERTFASLSKENQFMVKIICLLLTNKKYLSFQIEEDFNFQIFTFLKKYLENRDVIFGIESNKLIYNENITGYFINNRFFTNYEEAKLFLENKFEKEEEKLEFLTENDEKNCFNLRFNFLLWKRNYFFITNSVKFYQLSFCLMALYGFFGFFYLSYYYKFRYNLKEIIDLGNIRDAKFSYIKSNAIALYILVLSLCVTSSEFISLIMKNKQMFIEEIKNDIYDVKELMLCFSSILFLAIFFLVFCFVGVHNNYNVIFRFFTIFYNTTIISVIILQYALLLYLLIEDEFLMIVCTIILFTFPFIGKYCSLFKLFNFLPPIALHFFYIKSFFKGIAYTKELREHDLPFWAYLNNIFFNFMFTGLFKGERAGVFKICLSLVFVFECFLIVKLFFKKFGGNDYNLFKIFN